MKYDLKTNPKPAVATQVSAQFRSRSLSWKEIGTVRSLYLRVEKEPDPRRVQSLQTLANFGIVGDRHACPTSPRQILIAGEPVYRSLNMPEATLRENLLVDFPMEVLNSGDLLRIGSSTLLWITFECEPCSLLERRRPGTIKVIGKERGMLARVLKGGEIREFDAIHSVSSLMPPISSEWKARVISVAQSVPDGYYITYSRLAELAGVARAYCRAFPRVLAGLSSDTSAKVMSASVATTSQLWDGAQLFDRVGFLSIEHDAICA